MRIQTSLSSEKQSVHLC